MSNRTAVFKGAAPAESSSPNRGAHQPGPWSLLLLSSWCGLVAGLLEVAVTVLRRRSLDVHAVPMSRHFVWMLPLADLAIFCVLGTLLVPLVLWGRRGRWLAPRLLCALTLLPPIWAASPRLFGPAGLLLGLGAAARLVPVLEQRPAGLRRLVRTSFPVVVGIVALLSAWSWGQDEITEWREARRPLPPPGSPNVLLIVLDTVAAGHLSLYGYDRPTSPTIEELAPHGMRFDHAQATCSWTLPSHASLFTGRWPHELSTGWLTPLDGTYPTLAEFLGEHGYATAGFVGNYWYCATNSGLDRGFTVYRDFIFPRLTALGQTVLIKRPVEGLEPVELFLEDWLGIGSFLLRPAVERLNWLFKTNRKGAAVVNGEFLDWLSRRGQPERPFFAFLNYYDAHFPYQLSDTATHRFGIRSDDDPFEGSFTLSQSERSPRQIARNRDTYDNCVADLDEQLGELIDELERRAVLDQTWIIVVADHGESFGEHPDVVQHGSSLYQTEVHVPLLLIPPVTAGSRWAGRTVAEPVSLRDVPATIVDELGFRDGSPFHGKSLARFSHGISSAAPADRTGGDPVLSEVVPIDVLDPNPTQLLMRRCPLSAVADGGWTYIRREGDVREELYNLREDPQELHDRAADKATQPVLERMRQALLRLTAGPLTPERFNP
jgi:arylsulfatase A-like enzyme